MRMNLAKYARWECSSLNVLGMLLFIISILLLPSVLIANNDHESIEPFLWPMIIGIIVSLFLLIFMKRSSDMGPADGIFLMLVLWMGMFTFGIFPYILSGVPLVDAIFESVGGFATVGASVLDVTKMSNALLLWRTITNWIGGIVIVAMFMFILPMVVSGSRRLVKSETFGARTGNLTMKLGSVAKQFIGVYISLTVIFTIVLMLCSMSLFEAVNFSMSAISIGGFTITSDSLTRYGPAVKIALIVMMILSASNFYLHFRAVAKKDFSGYRQNEEFKYMILWLSLVIILAVAQMHISHRWDELSGNVFERYTDIIFNIVSIGTTAGFYTLNYAGGFEFMSTSLILLLMFIGGSSGSPAGGIKISRALIVVRSMFNEIRNEIHPNAVYTVQYEGSGADKSAVHASIVVVMLFLMTALVSTIVFDIFMDWNQAIYTSIALLSGTGTSIGEYFYSYASFPGWAKIFACIIMFLGRMEVVAILAVFTMSFWKELLGPRKINKMRDKAVSPLRYVEKKTFSRKSSPAADSESCAQKSADEAKTKRKISIRRRKSGAEPEMEQKTAESESESSAPSLTRSLFRRNKRE